MSVPADKLTKKRNTPGEAASDLTSTSDSPGPVGKSGGLTSPNVELINLMMEKGANDWDNGLAGACEGGHIKVVKFMASLCKDKMWWDKGLINACEHGHSEIVNFMIEKGADEWSVGLCEACKGGHSELIKLMIEKGAKYCWSCDKSIEEHKDHKALRVSSCPWW